MERAQARKRIDKLGEEIVQDLNYYAHTAVRMDGTPDPESGKLAGVVQTRAECLSMKAEPLVWLAGLDKPRRLRSFTGDRRQSRRFPCVIVTQYA
jgi:hypothetical protein